MTGNDKSSRVIKLVLTSWKRWDSICHVINDFLLKNWFDLLQSAFIVGGFVLSIIATRNDIRSRKVEYLLTINQSYREIWGKTYSQPELLRIRQSDLNLEEHPITEAERRMVKEIIIHLYAIYEAVRTKHLDKGEIEKDIYDFFHLPIPNTVWSEVKTYQNKLFVGYIDEILSKNEEFQKRN